MNLLVITVSISGLLWSSRTAVALNQNPLLLLISFDGFRYDLLNETLVPRIWQFAQKGVNYINGVQSQFPTFTMSNHASMATGLTVQDNGLTGNRFYDPVNHMYYDLLNISKKPDVVEASLDARFYKGEPIWLTNERAQNGRRSASIEWMAGEAPYPGEPPKPQVVRPYVDLGNLTKWKADFDYIMDLFLDDKEPVNFVAWYVGEPDIVLHENGFYNGKLEGVLSQLDALFDYAMLRIENETELAQKLHIILTSDHGHAEINGTDSVFCLPDYFNMTDVPYGDHMVYIEDAKKRDEAYEKWKSAIKSGNYEIDIYKKEEFPDHYHFARNIYVGDIIFVPHAGFAVHEKCTKELLASLPDFHKSTHGMEPEHWTMRSLLTMIGPKFKNNYKDETIANNIDLYSLMCFVLEIVPAPNNGTIDGFRSALTSALPLRLQQTQYTRYLPHVLTIILPVVCLISFYALWIFCKRDDDSRNVAHSNEYRSISQNADSAGHSRGSGRNKPLGNGLIDTSSEDEL